MRRGRGHIVGNARLETALGLGALVVAAVLLHDAYEHRGRKQPLWLKPLAFW